MSITNQNSKIKTYDVTFCFRFCKMFELQCLILSMESNYIIIIWNFDFKGVLSLIYNVITNILTL